MSDLTDLDRRVIGECLRAAVDGPFFAYYLKARDPASPAADAAWRAGRRHILTTRETFDRLGPVDWSEFSALFGLDRDEVARIAREWPAHCAGPDIELAVNNALNNLLGYPHRCEDVWDDYISVSPGELSAIFRRWRAARFGPATDGPGRKGDYFHGLL